VIRRGFWLAAGFGLGVAAATRARRQVEAAAARLDGSQLAARVRRDMARAFDEGRDEMRDREARLRHVLAAPHPARHEGIGDPGQ
jgi:hypothetical protein